MRKSGLYIELLISLVFTLFLLFSNVIASSSVRSLSLSVSSFYLGIERSFVNGIKDNYKALTKSLVIVRQLSLENQILREQLQKTDILEIQNIRLENELNDLRKLSNVAQNSSYVYITSMAINQLNDFTSGNIILNIGANHGIAKNSVALNQHGLIGRVSEVSEGSLSILTIFHPNSSIPIFGEQSLSQGTMQGGGSDNLKISPLGNTKVFFIEGETVLTSGRAGIFPRYIPVGTVRRTSQNSWVVQPFVNQGNIHYVTIMQNTDNR